MIEHSKEGVVRAANLMLSDLSDNMSDHDIKEFLKQYLYSPDLKAIGEIDAYVIECFKKELPLLKTALKCIEPQSIYATSKQQVYSVVYNDREQIEFWYSKKKQVYTLRLIMRSFIASYVRYYLY